MNMMLGILIGIVLALVGEGIRRRRGATLSVWMPEETKKQILWLQQKSGAPSVASLFAVAFSAYETILDEYAAGGRIIVTKINGESYELLPFSSKEERE